MHTRSFLMSALLPALCLATIARGAPLVYEGEAGPGKGKHIVLIASDHEYRSEETLPALARILAKHHGFKCTVVFTSTYGTSNDIENEGFRRMLVNACFWAAGLEDAIEPDANVGLVGPYHATWCKGHGRRKSGLKPEDMAGWESPIVPLQP